MATRYWRSSRILIYNRLATTPTNKPISIRLINMISQHEPVQDILVRLQKLGCVKTQDVKLDANALERYKAFLAGSLVGLFGIGSSIGFLLHS
jgi:hypothetical protein